jgi:hypothetical protein
VRKLLSVFITLALLVVLYGAAGAWLAPRFVRDALVDAAAKQGFTLRVAKVRTRPFALDVTLEGVELDGAQALATARAAKADISWNSLWRRAWVVRELSIERGMVRLLDPQLVFEDLNLRAREGRYEAAAHLVGAGPVASRGTVSLAPPGIPAVEIDGSVGEQGKFSARGSVDLQPLRANLQLTLQAVPLAFAQRWLPEAPGVRIESGTVSATGALTIREANASYQGAAAVRGLRLVERGSGALLIGWQMAETDSLKLAFAGIHIGELVVRAPEGRVVIAPDGTANIAALFGTGKGKARPLRAKLERLRIENGTLHFADHSLASPFALTLRDLSGAVSGIGAQDPARVRLAGRVQPYGTARIVGTIDIAAPTTRADVRARLRNVDLAALSPYVAKFAGYRIASGRLSANLRYELRDRRMVGSNDLLLERIELGEKLEAKGVFDLPLELAVALLADSRGRIELDVPVRGNLNDPQFDIGDIVGRAFRNALGKVISAPFRAIAALFGDDGGPGTVAFAAGSDALAPPAEEDVAQLAQALAERPRLGVTVHGGYDPERDLEGLRLRAAREEVARAAGVKGVPDLSDPKVVRAAERLYLKRVGERGELDALRKEEPRYGRALLQRLAAALPADPAAAQALARTRAEAVRAALLDHGVDAARVRIAEPKAQPADEEGVPTELALLALK